MKIAHDDGYTLYINGKKVSANKRSISKYQYIELDKEAAKALKPGKNIIAIHCEDKGGQRFIDAGFGRIDEAEVNKPDVVIELETVSQTMAFDKKSITVRAGEKVRIDFKNADEMPHNVVFLDTDKIEEFGATVDEMLSQSDAAERHYVPSSRYILASSRILDPGAEQSLSFVAPSKPGRYTFVCTYPGHWRMMQGTLVVVGAQDNISDNADAAQVQVVGGGSSHNFRAMFGRIDGGTLYRDGLTSVRYTEDTAALKNKLADTDVLILSNNKPIANSTRPALLQSLNEGMGLLVMHASAWNSWKDWPEYNREIVGGGSSSHEELQAFEVTITQPDHALVKGVQKNFTIVDELYRWKKHSQGADIEVLAVGRGLKSGKEFPVLWVVKHPSAKIVVNTLGHDKRAHGHKAYQTLLKNAVDWMGKR